MNPTFNFAWARPAVAKVKINTITSMAFSQRMVTFPPPRTPDSTCFPAGARFLLSALPAHVGQPQRLGCALGAPAAPRREGQHQDREGERHHLQGLRRDPRLEPERQVK